MKKKKVITTLICLALSLGIIGCNSGKNNSESVNNEKNTEINTEFTTELLGQKEDTTKYPIEVTKQYTNTEMQMFEGFIRGVSQASLVAGDENSERTSENLPDYRKELIYYYMMVFNDFKGLDSFEEEGLLKEISQRDDEITELVRNGYQLSAEQFCMGEEYIWKNGLKDKQEAIDFFENLIYEYDWLSKNPDGSYNLFECLEPGVPEIETISIWKTSKNTFSIEGQTKHIYDTDISDTYYIQVEAEVNEESPFGGMTVTKLTVSETPIQTDKQEIGQNLEWTQAYKDFLSNKENFVPLLLQDVDCDVSGYMEGFALQDIDEDAVPELLLCKMGKVPYVYIYSYSNGNVTHIGGTTCDPYNQAEHRKSFGFDEETGKAYIYTEGAFDMAVIYLQDMSNVTDEKLMEEYNDWYGEAPIEFEYERDLNYWNEHRKEIWANSTYDTFGDSKEEALEILHNFVPLKWHKITESEMASYICEDYYNINLEGEQEIGKSVFFEIDG
ncbi:MAG: hypothetical protein IKJ01_03665, partial [Lachnospiraceae bacterium]|nr:hypothetical protein [Lachnospiraceae bacterium]